MRSWDRRRFLRLAGSAGMLAALNGCATAGRKASGHVVVVGGGYGGATAAKYLRMWSEGRVAVTLVERNARFVSCPISNLAIVGEKTLEDITLGYDGLKRNGVTVVQDDAVSVDVDKRSVRLAAGAALDYDRLVLSPASTSCTTTCPASPILPRRRPFCMPGKPGRRLSLREQLEAMPDGGTYAICIQGHPTAARPAPTSEPAWWPGISSSTSPNPEY